MQPRDTNPSSNDTPCLLTIPANGERQLESTQPATPVVKGLLLLVLFIALLSCFARGAGFFHESMEGDEMFSRRVAMANSDDAVRIIRDDLVHPPFYYLILRPCVAIFGSDPSGLRALSLIAGLMTIGLLMFMAYVFKEIRGPAMFAALLLAVNDSHIFYSQQARSYALYTLFFCGLLFWCWLAERYERSVTFWCVGGLLMTVLVYTHYVAALYIACAVSGILLSKLSKRAKMAAVLAAVSAAIAFVPWIVFEYEPYLRKKGLDQNLGWQEIPTLYDLKAIWANFTGIPDVVGGTTVAFLASCSVIGVGIVCSKSRMSSFRTRFLLTAALTAVVPPCLLFLLSLEPFALPLFGQRHLLPSIVSWLILVGDGVWAITSRFVRPLQLRLAAAAVFLAFQLSPIIANCSSVPRRLPYQTIANELKGTHPVYTTYAYGIGEPVSYYMNGRASVQELPANPESELPSAFVVIHRPWNNKDTKQLAFLSQPGWTIREHKDYTGAHSANHCVRVLHVMRTPSSQLS